MSLPKIFGLLVAVGALVGAPAAGATQRPPELQWEACGDGIECATAQMPRDYAHPHGAQLELALIRRPATDREHRIGSLFMNPGGPGGSGVEFVRTMPPPAQQVVGRRFDIVGFDPRGVGASKPAVDCADTPASSDSQRFMTPETLDVPTLLRDARAKARRCLTGPHRDVAPYLTTVSAATTPRRSSTRCSNAWTASPSRCRTARR
jgi:pimeloyl-ACP methyl ester carboxylesterase